MFDCFSLLWCIFKGLVVYFKSKFFYIGCFLKEFKKYGVIILVRVCDVIYDKVLVEKEGIYVLVSV